MVEVANVMRSVAAEDVAALIITHDMDLVAECCDRVLVLEEGRVRFEGPRGRAGQSRRPARRRRPLRPHGALADRERGLDAVISKGARAR